MVWSTIELEYAADISKALLKRINKHSPKTLKFHKNSTGAISNSDLATVVYLILPAYQTHATESYLKEGSKPKYDCR